MAVYIKPDGMLGTTYMAAINPFRHLIVCPRMIRQIGRDARRARRKSWRPVHVRP